MDKDSVLLPPSSSFFLQPRPPFLSVCRPFICSPFAADRTLNKHSWRRHCVTVCLQSGAGRYDLKSYQDKRSDVHRLQSLCWYNDISKSQLMYFLSHFGSPLLWLSCIIRALVDCGAVVSWYSVKHQDCLPELDHFLTVHAAVVSNFLFFFRVRVRLCWSVSRSIHHFGSHRNISIRIQ